MKTNQADYPVRSICRVLGLSPSGYYASVTGRFATAGLAKNMERIALLLGFANLLVAGRYSTA